MASRLQEKYNNQVAPAMMEKFGYKNIMEMTPMPKDIPWRIQLEDIINIEKDAFLNTYRMEKGGQVLNYFIRDNGTMSTFSVYSTD